MAREIPPDNLRAGHLNSLFCLASHSCDDEPWAITGSMNLCLRGVKIHPRDIDVITTIRGADIFSGRIPGKCELPFGTRQTDSIRSYFGVLSLNGVSIEIMADAAVRSYTGQWMSLSEWFNNLEFLTIAGFTVPLTSLEFERKVYAALAHGSVYESSRRSTQVRERCRVGGGRGMVKRSGTCPETTDHRLSSVKPERSWHHFVYLRRTNMTRIGRGMAPRPGTAS